MPFWKTWLIHVPAASVSGLWLWSVLCEPSSPGLTVQYTHLLCHVSTTLVQCWVIVGDDDPTLNQSWASVFSFLNTRLETVVQSWQSIDQILGCTPKTVWFSCYINLPSLVHCSVGVFASGDPLYNLFIRLQMLYVDQWSDNYDFVTHSWLIQIIGRRRWRCNAQLALDWIIGLLTWMW